MPGDPSALFREPSAPTVGIEEELMVLDPATLDLMPAGPALVELAAGDPAVAGEMPAAQVELRTGAHRTVAEAARDLAAARARLAGHAEGRAVLAAAGTHPFAPPEGPLSPGPRYALTAREFGPIARRQLVYGLHVHVAVRPAERALAVHNALRSHLPTLAALAANAPFHAGADTGLASARPLVAGLLPRQGVPPAIPSWEALAAALRWGAASGAVPDPGRWWWELRLNLRMGTVEVRVPDAQSTVADAAAVAALAHALAWDMAERHAAGERLPVHPGWRIAENRWWACRDGDRARLADLDTGVRRPLPEVVDALAERLAPAAAALGCAGELEAARALARRCGAARQREVAAADGLTGLVRWLAGRFAPAGPG